MLEALLTLTCRGGMLRDREIGAAARGAIQGLARAQAREQAARTPFCKLLQLLHEHPHEYTYASWVAI